MKTPDPNGPYTANFEMVWGLHRKGGKRSAFKAWLKAVPKPGFDLDDVVLKLNNYVHETDHEYQAHLSSWLNGEHWEENIGGTGESGYRPPKFYSPDWVDDTGLTPIKNPLK
jgi:hypothetical protein